jgi:WD40 repeat protein
MSLFGPSSGFGGGGGILGGFGAMPAAATPFGGGIGGSNGGLGAPALGVVRNTWVPDAGEERFVICHGLRGSVSSLSWFSAHPLVALTTWDGEIQVLKVQQQQLQVMANLHLSASAAPPGQPASPLLSSACQGTTVAVGGCDGKLRVWNPEQGTTAITEWGAHADAIKKVMVLESSQGWPAAGFLTGSFDKTVALWSAPGQPAAKIDARFKVYAMDGLVPYILLAGSDRNVSLRDLRKSGEAVYSGFSPLQWQTRCACLIPGPNGSQQPYGYSIGGIDGTLGVVPFFERPEDSKRIEVTSSPSKGPRNRHI